MFWVIDLIDDEHDRRLRFAQHAREFLIDRGQPLFCIDNEKQNVALVQSFLGGAVRLCDQF